MPTPPNPSPVGPFAKLHEFDDGEQAADALASAVETRLREGLAKHGRATLVGSGGSTPKRLYEILSETRLDWSKVTVVLADERWVDPGQKGSNESFLIETLLQNEAAAANFVGLKTSHARPADAVDAVDETLARVHRPFDAVVLGMGGDGHTLSWFPEADGLNTAIAPDGKLAAAVTAHPSEVTGPFVERMTLTLAALKGACLTALLISGDAKRKVWSQAAEPGRVEALPVRAVLNAPDLGLQTYWWP
jgi:6-phosphogluconolactonase